MAIRIDITWTVVQPFLRLLVGELEVINIDSGYTTVCTRLYRCVVKVENNSISYSAYEDDKTKIPTFLSELLREHVHTIINSYVAGFHLNKYLNFWVKDSFNQSLGSWGKQKFESMAFQDKKEFERTCCSSKVNYFEELPELIEKSLQKLLNEGANKG